MGFLNKLFGGGAAPAAHDAFVPLNDLERLLLAIHRGDAGRSELPHQLVKSRLFLLFSGEPEEMMAAATAQPLAIQGERGYPGVCVFSASKRAMALQAQHPEFRTGIETEFAWVLEICPPGVGILINPGSPFTIELHPDGVAPTLEGVRRGEFG